MKQLSLNNFFWVIILFIFYILVTSPILQAGFFSDDALNSTIPGEMQLAHIENLWELGQYYNNKYLLLGRIFPVSAFMGTSFFYYFTDPFIYQIARIACILLSLITMALAIRLLTHNTRSALLFLFLVPAFWSVRDFHDPLTSFGPLIPMVTFFVSVSIICFIKYVQFKKIIWQLLSVLFYACALLSYEIGIVAFFGMCVVAWYTRESLKNFIMNMLPAIIVTVVYFSACFILRMHVTSVYDGIQFGTLGLGFWRTFSIQLTAVFPLSYLLMAIERNIFHEFMLWLPRHPIIQIASILIFLITFIALKRLGKQVRLNKKLTLCVFLFSLCFLMIPTLMISLSGKYQSMLTWGVGYLPVYLEYLGAALLLLLLLNKLNVSSSRFSLFLKSIFISTISVITAFAFLFNTYMVVRINDNWQNGRNLLVTALQTGLLKTIPEKSLIIKKHSGGNVPAFYKQYGDKIVDVLDVEYKKQLHPYLISGMSSLKNFPNQSKFLIDYNHLPMKNEGWVILSELISANFQKNTSEKIKSFSVKNPKLFIMLGSPEETTKIIDDLRPKFIFPSFESIRALTDILKITPSHTAILIDLPPGNYLMEPTW